jgi:hypothetical protein
VVAVGETVVEERRVVLSAMALEGGVGREMGGREMGEVVGV